MCSKCAVCSVQSSICGHLDIAPRPVKTPDDDRGQLVNQSTHLWRAKTTDSLNVVTCDQCILLDKSVSSTHWIMFNF